MYVGTRVFSDVPQNVRMRYACSSIYRIIHDKNNIIQSYVIIVVKSKNSMKNYCIVSRYLLLGHCSTLLHCKREYCIFFVRTAINEQITYILLCV